MAKLTTDQALQQGVEAHKKGQIQEARRLYAAILKVQPKHPDANHNTGLLAVADDQIELALPFFKTALEANPSIAQFWYSHIVALIKLDRLVDAKILLDQAKRKGIKGADFDQLEQRLNDTNKAPTTKPISAGAYNNMGNVLNNQGNLEEAIFAYKKAISIQPDYVNAYYNMGNALKDQGNLEEAIEAYSKALAIKPDYADAYYNSSFVYNLRGEIQKGLELYEYRFKKQKAPTRAPREKLYWNGLEPIKGKEFLVYEEQGLGDIIQFCRYLPTLVKQGAKVTFKVTQKLHALLRTLESDIILVDRLPDESQIDFEAPIMSLPHLLNTNLETIPSIETYLSADYLKVVSWGKLLNAQKFKIGICWQGSKSKIDIGRSFPLSLFEGISKLPNVELISLHKGEGEKQIQEIKFNLTTLGSDFDAGQDAFLDTSAVIKNCDLVITSDTAVAHLAGSLGCETWLILKHVPDWRWMLNRTDSPWYPTMSLYRQKTPGNWADVFTAVEQKLFTKLEEGK